eukprot:Ihof_evm25s6 gene=Ihof_evmTU25s6
MPIIYSVVANGLTILAEYTNSTGNFPQITKIILEKLPNYDTKMSYIYDRYVFHYTVYDGIVYLCMADETFPRRLAFSFLEDIHSRFISLVGPRALTAPAYSLNTEFGKVLQHQMDYYSFNPNADRILQVQGEIDEVKKVMVENIEKVLQRGEHIHLLVGRTDTLNEQGMQFKRGTSTLRRQAWWKNVKMMVMLVFMLL